MRNFIDLFGRKPAVVWHDDNLGDTLAMFKREKSHMAIVRDVENDGSAVSVPLCSKKKSIF